MHFCFSSMSYNLIRNFWCVAGYLNIKIFRWSHWISHPCEIPWDVSCCLSVSPFALSLSLSLSRSPPLFSLSPLSRISISVFSWTRALTDCLSTPPLETEESSRTSGNLNGCQRAWECQHRADLIWMKGERLCSLSGRDWKMITLGFSPDCGKTRGGGGRVTATSWRHVEACLPAPFVSRMRRMQPVDLTFASPCWHEEAKWNQGKTEVTVCHAVHSFCLNRESGKDIWCDNSTRTEQETYQKGQSRRKTKIWIRNVNTDSNMGRHQSREQPCVHSFFLTNKDT